MKILLKIIIFFSFLNIAQSEGERAWVWGTLPYLDENNQKIVYNEPFQFAGKIMFIDVKSYGNATIFVGVGIAPLYVMGDNSYGKLGVGHYETPVKFDTLENQSAIHIDMCSNSTLIIKGDKTLWVSGKNNYSKFGDDIKEEMVNEFTQIEIGSKFHYAWIHDDYIIAIKDDKTIWSCGRNKFGVLGLGDTINRTSFTKIDFKDSLIYGAIQNIILGDNAVYAFDNRNIHMWGNTYEFDHIERINYKPISYSIGWLVSEALFRDGYYLILCNGKIYGWGTDTKGRSQNLTQSSTSFTQFPDRKISNEDYFNQIGLSENHCIATINPSSWINYTWGTNTNGNFGFKTKDSTLYNYTHFPFTFYDFELSLAKDYTVILGGAGTRIDIRGYVLNEDKGVEGVKLSIDTLEVYSDKYGEYRFENLPIDSHIVRAISPLYTFEIDEKKVELKHYIGLQDTIFNINFNVKEIHTKVNNNSNNYVISPNPTLDIINLNLSEAIYIELFDIFGNKLLEDYNTKLNISHLSPGTYYIRFLGQTKMVVKI